MALFQQNHSRIMMMIAVCLTAAVSFARTLAVGTLQPAGYVDTETVTNCPFAFSNQGIRRLVVSLDLFAMPSNDVEIAFGRDADSDGMLSVDEIALAVGWDSGGWVLREGLATGSRTPQCLVAPDVADATYRHLRFETAFRGGRADSVSATENGSPVEWNLSDPLPTWIFDGSWNMVRLAVRGNDASYESMRVKAEIAGTQIVIR